MFQLSLIFCLLEIKGISAQTDLQSNRITTTTAATLHHPADLPKRH